MTTIGWAPATITGYLNVYRNTSFAGVTPYVQLAIGDPGVLGTANKSALLTRNAILWNAPVSATGAMSLLSLSGFVMTASETISHATLWTTSTDGTGTFLQSVALTVPIPVIAGSTISFQTFGLAIGPVAA